MTRYRVEVVKDKSFPYKKKRTIQESKDVFEVFGPVVEREAQEVFYVVLLGTRKKIEGFVEVSRGTLTSSSIHPREVFKPAVVSNAHSVIFLHNHPSGDPNPSRADVLITKKLKDAGDILGIRVLDHIIVGEENYYSFADKGLIK